MNDVEKMIGAANALVVKGKGILAADESSGTIKKRFDSINLESTENNRRDYREMLFTTRGINEFISGVILYEETLFQNGKNGQLVVKALQDAGIILGIKVDKGTVTLPGTNGELMTEGLDGLRARLQKYREAGAQFTKWRAVFNIGANLPSRRAIAANAHILALYALLSQVSGLVPIVEPEVLMDGDHSIEACRAATEQVLTEVFYSLQQYKVNYEGCILKANMVLPGKTAANQASPVIIARQTIDCLKATVPASIPGVVFLSGGQGDDESVANLNSINIMAKTAHVPWQLTFSYGRGLQSVPLKAWAGKPENLAKGQKAFYDRAKVTALAREGLYKA
ncbi:MAG: fructose-bisphosphate aldolase class I [Dehalococcoidales bacterium]|nr:fructose-bisphosphate aldolase class I [Dehalococcoidales bacterium]